jgi:primary-amine oxidase
MVNVKAVEAKHVEAPAAGEAPPDAYGRLIRASMVAVNHDHFLSYRLDLDVDGPQNSVVVDRITPQRLPAASPRKSLWTVQSQTLRSEREGSLHMNMERPSLWRVTNPARRGPTGYPVSYQLRPGHTAMSLLAPEDNPQVRGGFSSHTLWVTRQDDRQRLAAGPYSTGAKRAGGVPAWAAADRPLENADVVLWYTMGMHHVVRAEDWPVMPVVWHELELRPFDFFAKNPALDLPR